MVIIGICVGVVLLLSKQGFKLPAINLKTTPIPAGTTVVTTPFWDSRSGKAVKLGLLVAAGAFVYFFWPETLPGKAMSQGATSSGITEEWRPYVMVYPWLAILAWIGYRILFNKGGESKSSEGSGWSGFFKGAMFVMVSAALVALVMNLMNKPEDSTHELNFQNAQPGSSQRVVMGLNDTIALKIKLTNVSLGYIHHYCPKAVNQEDFKFPVKWVEVGPGGTTKIFVRLTDETKAKLTALNVSSVNTEITMMMGGVNDWLCEFEERRK